MAEDETTKLINAKDVYDEDYPPGTERRRISAEEHPQTFICAIVDCSQDIRDERTWNADGSRGPGKRRKRGG